ncbi:Rabconnectin-3B, isoform A, partial [Nowakowskiella sp. JEL0078]
MTTVNTPISSTSPVVPPHILLTIEKNSKTKTANVTVQGCWASLFGSQLVASIHRYRGGLIKSPSNVNGGDSDGSQIPVFDELSFTNSKVNNEDSVNISAATLVMEKYMAAGLDNGDIAIVLISTAFFHHPTSLASQSVLRITNAHEGRVTALFSPDEHFVPVATSPTKHSAGNRAIGTGKERHHLFQDDPGSISDLSELEEHETEEKILLLSGGVDCKVKIWNLVNGDQLASFVCHSGWITSFMPIPMEMAFGHRMRHAVLSFSKDHSVTVIDCEGLECHGRFTSHTSAIVSVGWMTRDNQFIVECEDGTVYVWNVKTCHVDRIIPSSVLAEEVLDSLELRLPVREFGHEYLSANPKSTISAFPLHNSVDDTPAALIIMANIKRLVSDIHSGFHTLSPTPPQTSDTSLPQSPTTSDSDSESTNSTTISKPTTPGSGVATFHRRRHLVDTPPAIRRASSTETPSLNKHKLRAGIRGAVAVAVFKLKARSAKRRIEIGRKIVVGKVSGGGDVMQHPASGERADAEVVQSVFSALVDWRCGEERVVMGECGLKPVVNTVTYAMRGAGGFLSVMVPSESRHNEWNVSAAHTANKLVQILALARSVLAVQRSEVDEEIVAAVVEYYSSTVFSKDGDEKVLFPSFAFLARYWQDPVVDVQVAARTLFNSTLLKIDPSELSGIIDHWRSYLPIWNGQTVSLGKNNMRATIILGIIGSCSQPMLDTQSCKEVTISLDLIIKNDIKNSYRATAIELIGAGFHSWQPHLNFQHSLKQLLAFTGLATLPSSAKANLLLQSAPVSEVTPTVMMTARQTIITIAEINPLMFVVAVANELVNGKNSVADRIG